MPGAVDAAKAMCRVLMMRPRLRAADLFLFSNLSMCKDNTIKVIKCEEIKKLTLQLDIYRDFLVNFAVESAIKERNFLFRQPDEHCYGTRNIEEYAQICIAKAHGILSEMTN